MSGRRGFDAQIVEAGVVGSPLRTPCRGKHRRQILEVVAEQEHQPRGLKLLVRLIDGMVQLLISPPTDPRD